MYNNPQIECKTKIEGWYRVQKHYPGQEPHFDSGFFPNLITNLGMDQIGNRINGQNYCHVGTGNAAPAFTNTQLSNFLTSQARTSKTVGINNVVGNYYGWVRNIYVFGKGTAAGNLAELGVSSSPGSGNLFSRALILDGGGAPTTITVLANEILTVTYEYRMHYVTDDVPGSINISGITYALVTRPLSITDNNFYANSLPNDWEGPNDVFRSLTSKETQTLVPPTDNNATFNQLRLATNLAYVAGSFYMERTVLIDIDSWNYPTGIGAVNYASAMSTWQTSFTPKIAKDNTKTLQLTVRWTWARA
jgi:hypothetical protein